MNLQSLIEYIARALVENKDEVSANVKEDSEGYVVELHVAQADMGRVIGKGGRIANALRTLVRIAAMREGKRVSLDIV